MPGLNSQLTEELTEVRPRGPNSNTSRRNRLAYLVVLLHPHEFKRGKRGSGKGDSHLLARVEVRLVGLGCMPDHLAIGQWVRLGQETRVQVYPSINSNNMGPAPGRLSGATSRSAGNARLRLQLPGPEHGRTEKGTIYFCRVSYLEIPCS